MRSEVIDIVEETRRNTAYRRVLATNERSQLVAMALPPRGQIGAETHPHTSQTIVIVDGFGTAMLDGARYPLRPGDALVVAPGTRHNVICGPIPMKLFTVYAPPNHLPHTVHQTRRDAELDHADQDFGRRSGGY